MCEHPWLQLSSKHSNICLNVFRIWATPTSIGLRVVLQLQTLPAVSCHSTDSTGAIDPPDPSVLTVPRDPSLPFHWTRPTAPCASLLVAPECIWNHTSLWTRPPTSCRQAWTPARERWVQKPRGHYISLLGEDLHKQLHRENNKNTTGETLMLKSNENKGRQNSKEIYIKYLQWQTLKNTKLTVTNPPYT